MTTATPTPSRSRGLPVARDWLLEIVSGRLHRRAVLLYLIVVASHFAEHLAQIAQVHLLGTPRPAAGGLLGLALPGLAMAEVLHTAWNSLQLTGLILLLPGFARAGRGRGWWTLALALQTWHWVEHAVIQVQYVTGIYLYGAIKQTSILERLLPRVELHFLYNVAVFVPTVIAVVLYMRSRRAAPLPIGRGRGAP